MKKMFILLIFISTLLSSCSLISKQKIEMITVGIAAVAIPSDILVASEPFSAELRSYLFDKGYDVANLKVKVFETHADLRTALENQEVDIAYLPSTQYLRVIDKTQYIASVTRPHLDMKTDLATYNQATQSDKPIANLAYRNALIYTGPSAYGKELYQKFLNNEVITWIDLNVASWCHVVVTDLEGYIYPSLWLVDNYERRMGELFNHSLEERGYDDVVKSLASESCDVGVGPSLLRYDYASLWNTEDYGGQGNIFDAIKVIGVTRPIYDNVFVARVLLEEDELDEMFFTTVQDFLVLQNEAEEKPELFKTLGFVGIEILSVEEYQTMIPALDYIERIMS